MARHLSNRSVQVRERNDTAPVVDSSAAAVDMIVMRANHNRLLGLALAAKYEVLDVVAFFDH
jgi:hypothetical protein